MEVNRERRVLVLDFVTLIPAVFCSLSHVQVYFDNFLLRFVLGRLWMLGRWV